MNTSSSFLLLSIACPVTHIKVAGNFLDICAKGVEPAILTNILVSERKSSLYQPIFYFVPIKSNFLLQYFRIYSHLEF